MYVLNVNIFCQIRDLFRVKFMPKEKETGSVLGFMYSETQNDIVGYLVCLKQFSTNLGDRKELTINTGYKIIYANI